MIQWGASCSIPCLWSWSLSASLVGKRQTALPLALTRHKHVHHLPLVPSRNKTSRMEADLQCQRGNFKLMLTVALTLKNELFSLLPVLCLVAQSCLTLCDPTDCHAPLSMGILQTRILEWVAHSSRGSSKPRDQTQVSLIAGGFFTLWATREAQEYCSGEPIPSPVDLPNPRIKPGIKSDCRWIPELPGKPSLPPSPHVSPHWWPCPF